MSSPPLPKRRSSGFPTCTGIQCNGRTMRVGGPGRDACRRRATGWGYEPASHAQDDVVYAPSPIPEQDQRIPTREWKAAAYQLSQCGLRGAAPRWGGTTEATPPAVHASGRTTPNICIEAAGDTYTYRPGRGAEMMSPPPM